MSYRLELDRAGNPALKRVDLPPEPTAPPPGVAGDEWSRRRDAVREAAREFETLAPQDLRERLKGVTNRTLADDEVQQFTGDVRQQQLDDLVDIVDQRTRGRRRGRRTVRIQAPRGYVRKTMNALTDVERKDLVARLRARGWNEAEVADLALKHLKGTRGRPSLL